MLHERVSAQTLGFVRIWVFGICFADVQTRSLGELARFPADLCTPVGVLHLLPTSAFEFVWSVGFLTAVEVVLSACLCLVVLGVGYCRLFAVAACVLLTLYHALVRSIGHISHGELALLYTAFVLAAFPIADGFALRRSRPRYSSDAVYRAPLIASALLLCMTYMFVGARRFCASRLQIFLDGSITHFVAVRSAEHGPYGTDYGLAVLDHPWAATMLEVSFPIVTLFELLAPLCLFHRRFRYVWIVVMLAFHVMSRLFLQIWFIENVLLIPVLLTNVDRLFSPRLATGRAPIIFYDDECAWCSRFVRWMLARDAHGIFRFAPLRGATARGLCIEVRADSSTRSLILIDENGEHRRSDAALRAVARLGGGWLVAVVLLLIPRRVRDGVYRRVARRCFRRPGKARACPVLTDEERARLLP